MFLRYQHYDLEYDFPELDHLFLPPNAIELIPKADPKHLRRRRGIWSGLQVRHRRRTHHPPLQSILLANVQSLDNKVDQLRERISIQRHIRDCNTYSVSQKHGSLRIYCLCPYSQLGS
jgi:hypothetical protein